MSLKYRKRPDAGRAQGEARSPGGGWSPGARRVAEGRSGSPRPKSVRFKVNMANIRLSFRLSSRMENTRLFAIRDDRDDNLMFAMCIPKSVRFKVRLCIRFRGGLVFEAHRLLYYSDLGLRVIKKRRSASAAGRRENELKGFPDFMWKPRPDYGLDCLICAMFAGQRHASH